MTVKETKESFIDALYRRAEQNGFYIRQVNEEEYQTRCPFCGDSQSNFNTGHLYINVNPDNNFPIVYNCFKCDEHGAVNSEFLNIMDLDDINLKSSIISMNKNADSMKSHDFLYGDKIKQFGYKIPKFKRSDKTKYIERRLGKSLSDDELMQMKVITSLKDFLELNNIKKLTLDKKWCQLIEKQYVGFLSFGGSHILFRDIYDNSKFSWIKYFVTAESKQCRAFYSMEADIDVFTEDKLTINLSEGVMDILSVYKNLGFNEPNTMNIAVCGKHYVGILTSLVKMGLVGDNVIVNIFSDNDKVFNKKNTAPTTPVYFKKLLSRMRELYGEVNIYYNRIGKDFGVPMENISLEVHKI